MKFRNLASRALRNMRSNKDDSTSEEVNYSNEKKNSKIPMWILGGGLGGLMFAVAASFIVIIAVLIHLEIIEIDFDSSSGSSGGFGYDNSCDYEGTTVTVMDLKKEKVLATVSLEDYIIGVACIEVGACRAGSSIDENYIKSQYVASRTYVLERGRYNSSTKSITIRSSTADQAWCDLEKGCYRVDEQYIDGKTYEVYYPADSDNPAVWKYKEEDLVVLRQWYKETYGELFIKEGYDQKIDSLPLTGTMNIAYKSTTQNFWSWMASRGNKYGAILVATANPTSYNYTSYVADSNNYANKDIYQLKTACNVTSGSNYSGLDSYPLNGGGATKLSTPITQVLTSSEIDNINDKIISYVDESGRGTGNGVAAAATALLMGLYENGIYLPYYYGGGHSRGITTGIDLDWGKTGLGDYQGRNVSKGRYYYSYDCSAFVSWAIKNGACPNFASRSTAGFVNIGNSIAFEDVTPGDVFNRNNGDNAHIILVVKNNGDGTVVTAESTTAGVIFRNYSKSDITGSGYTIIDMDQYYSTCSS